MALRESIGVKFSELKDNHDKVTEFEVYIPFERYGDLPGGGCYGVGALPNWADPWTLESQFVVFGEDGKVIGGSGQIIFGHKWVPSPDAVVASPLGDAIVWLENGQLWVWERQREGYWGYGDCWSEDRLVVPNDPAIVDARMNANGMLDVWCEDGSHYQFAVGVRLLFLMDEQGPFLCLMQHGAAGYRFWSPRAEGADTVIPGVVGVIVDEGVDVSWIAYTDYREVRLLEGVTRIEWLSFCQVPELRRVVIPASVETVEWFAFHDCPKLSDLVIEGDLTRLATWDEKAFAGCPCEEEYLRLRREAAADT